MQSPFDTRFFQVFAKVAEAQLGAQHVCAVAAKAAAASLDPLVFRTARDEIDTLTPELRDPLLAETHRRLATDISAIWDQLPGASRTDRMN